MKKIALTIPEAEQIEINGHVFTIQLPDREIINRGILIRNKYKNLDNNDLDAIAESVNESVNLIDEILGEGAVKKISGGKPVSCRVSVEWLTAICQAIGKAADEYIAEEYE